MDAARLDAEARLRAEVRALVRDCRLFGVPTEAMRNKNIFELRELRDRAARQMMGAPTAA